MGFDLAAYWAQRHEQLARSERAIEHLGQSEEQALATSSHHRQAFSAALRLPAMRSWRHRAPRSALDLGAGIGRFSQPLREAGYDYLGVELSPIAVARARATYPGVKMRVCDVRDFRSKTKFDLIVCSYVLIHIVEDADWYDVLRNIAATLSSDGRFFLIDDLDEPTSRPAPHVALRNRSKYAEAFQTIGLHFSELTRAFRQLHKHYNLMTN